MRLPNPTAKPLVLSAFIAISALMMTTHGHAGESIVKGPWSQQVTATSATVRVEVDPPSSVSLELGTSGTVVEDREVRAIHAFHVENLQPATRYAVTAKARGSSRSGAIVTAPRNDSGAPFRFLVYGDNRSDDAAHAAIVRAMTAVPSDLLVHTGDFVESGASHAQWQRFFDIEAPLLRERCLFGSVGNHELVDGAGVEYVRYFGPADRPLARSAPVPSFGAPAVTPLSADASITALTPEHLMGTHRWSNARFFLINGMVDHRTGPARDWLKKALTESWGEPGLVWRIVVVHHGPWSSGPHGDNARFHSANIPELLRSHKVDLVISGHDHIYERGIAGGLPYLVSGGGGAPTYPIRQAEGTSRRHESARHFIDASATADAIQFAAIRPDGSTIERCSLTKAGWDCDAKAAPPSASAATPVEPAVAPKARCGCRAAGSDVERSPTMILLGLAVAALFARRRPNERISPTTSPRAVGSRSRRHERTLAGTAKSRAP